MKTHKTIGKAVMLALLVPVAPEIGGSEQLQPLSGPGFAMKGEVPAALFAVPGRAPSPETQTEEPAYEDLAGPKKQCWIGEDHYFVHRFVEPPKFGTAILKIELFDKNGERVTDLEIVGRADMPSMRGAHDSGEVAFKRNKKGDYLLPVNIVMAGEWEVRLHFLKGTDVVYRGSLKFHV
jgi:hypothetical protein